MCLDLGFHTLYNHETISVPVSALNSTFLAGGALLSIWQHSYANSHGLEDQGHYSNYVMSRVTASEWGVGGSSSQGATHPSHSQKNILLLLPGFGEDCKV